jgi:hypothetical protein
MSLTATIPDPATIRRRMDSCRQELASLRKLLRMSMALRTAEEARRQREQDGAFPAPPTGEEGGGHGR